MLLESIAAHKFRNLSGEIFWAPGFNIIHGNNGQGKTNWIEAIHTLARSKSFRTQHLQESIKFGEQCAEIKGRVTHGAEVSRDLQIIIHGNSKSISVNTKREPLARYLAQIHVVTFTANELEVVRGLPDARRRFLDRGVSSLRPAYIQTLVDYNRVIKQKNRILRDVIEKELGLAETEELIAPWNQQLIGLAAQIHQARFDYVERLNQVLERRVFGGEEISLDYVSSLEGKGDLNDYEGLIAERLRLRLQAEISSGYSLIGPHRDDLSLLFDGREMRVYGSSGQQRSALLLLDLAVISLYNLWHSDYPLFLIDDVDAELDEKRIEKLLEYLEGRTQTFITTSKKSHVGRFISRAKTFEIEDGVVVRSRESDSLMIAAG
ncbi:MAG TPA: DNA replication and repair protein RecF [Pyrinomonadaceae bacterium]|nr:DNA replication and repair protein RecF [Pyrinomonadaceae bacterium]